MHDSGSRIRLGLMAVCIAIVSWANGMPIPQESALERARSWMAGNPVMKGAIDRPVAETVTFPDSGGYSVYVVRYAPNGYVVLNSDDRLPLVVSFSADSTVDLSDDPQNTFRAMLQQYVERMEAELLTAAEISRLTVAAEAELLATTELYGPFLETSWNQCNPYNKLCPDDPGGTAYYDYRVPTGCTPTAYSQLMQFHRWPLFGQGSFSYTDSSGSITGVHSAVFSDEYAWASMLNSYDSGGANPVATEDAVAELMYELGVAAEADFESSATSSSVLTLSEHLSEFLYYETSEYQGSQSSLIAPMEADLRAGFPCIVAIPGHAVVADGLMVDGGSTTYHINYGWGGTNNGWWSADGIPGGALQYGVTSLRPRLMAFPGTNSVSGSAGNPVELQWILPKRREAEVQQLDIRRLEQQTGTWSTGATEIPTANNAGWELVAAGRSGNGWYAGPAGPASLVLDEIFVPDASTSLTFWMSYRLGTATFTVSVSTDGGQTYSEVYSANNNLNLTWSQKSVSLAAYAGQEIRLRFGLSAGSYYSGGGVWLDDLQVTAESYFAWAPFAVDTTLASRRISSVSTLWDEAADFSGFEVTSTSTYKDWKISTTSGVANCFYKQPGGYSNRAYHLTSLSTITPTASTYLLLHAKYDLATDQFRVSVSTDRSTFSEVWSTSSSTDWSDVQIDLSAYAGQPVYVRLEYVHGIDYYTDGGIWVDSVSTAEVTNPELEGQPVYYTTLTNLAVGTYTLAAVLVDTNGIDHGAAPSFTVTITAVSDDGDLMPTEWEELYGLDPLVDDGGLDPDLDGYSNYEEYICGTVPTNSASCWLLETGADSLPTFYAMNVRLYTIQYCSNLLEGIWVPLAVDIPGTNGAISVHDYDPATSPVRYYRVQVREAN